jgi:hypothetical protein
LAFEFLEFLLFAIDRKLALLFRFGCALETRLPVEPVAGDCVLPGGRERRQAAVRLATALLFGNSFVVRLRWLGAPLQAGKLLSGEDGIIARGKGDKRGHPRLPGE